MPNYEPTTPTARQIKPSEHGAKISGVVYNVEPNEGVRIVVEISKSKTMSGSRTIASAAVKNGERATVNVTGLASGTRYYVKMWSRDAAGNKSNSYANEDFRTTGTAPSGGSSGHPVTAHAPHPPTDVKINGEDAVDDQITESTGQVSLSAVVDDPDADTQTVRLVAQYSPVPDFSSQVRTEISVLVKQGKRATVTLKGLSQNTLYKVRLYARDSTNRLSDNWTGASFWTNRSPTDPAPIAPAENAQIAKASPITFTWDYNDPDKETGAIQGAYEIRWRTASTPNVGAGPWAGARVTTSTRSHSIAANTLLANTYYEWQVRVMDPQGAWSQFSYPQSFYITGTSLAPALVEPARGEAVDVAVASTFSWAFRDPDQGDSQQRADLRYRVVGTEAWFLVTGDTTTPGSSQRWTLPAETFMAGLNYEWQVRTLDSLSSSVSDWSESGNFWTIRTPGSDSELSIPLPDFSEPLETLGCGSHRVFVYDRGGKTLRGEITPLVNITWGRKRDDISNCIINTNGFGADCCLLLSELRSWVHELVVFRDGVRVWEGPITRITYTPDAVEVEAKDVMAYVYRRVLRQGYNDSFQLVDAAGRPITQWVPGAMQRGLTTVVNRAERITMNALAPDDPNILPYLLSIKFPDDTRQSRVVPDYSRTAWEEIDDLAATAGLDYTTAGRRIIYWDTHRYIGKLPEMRDENFSAPPVVTEYGMQLATDFAVSNNNGIWGLAQRERGVYGLIEQLASAYGETEGAPKENLTGDARIELERTLSDQAGRNIAHRWPTPLIVRVPDNSTINPDTGISINQLIPGVWIPLRARGTCRDVTQWQKLDLVTVTQDSTGEKITVSMSPAPNGGEDPDADSAATED